MGNADPITVSRPISPAQIRAIHVGKREAGMDNDTYRELLGSYGVASSRELTMALASEVIERLASATGYTQYRATPKPRPAKTSSGNLICLATPAQRAYIEKLKAQVAWREQDGFERFLKSRMRIEQVGTKKEASRVIEGLKGLLEHGHALPV